MRKCVYVCFPEKWELPPQRLDITFEGNCVTYHYGDVTLDAMYNSHNDLTEVVVERDGLTYIHNYYKKGRLHNGIMGYAHRTWEYYSDGSEMMSKTYWFINGMPGREDGEKLIYCEHWIDEETNPLNLPSNCRFIN